MPLFFSLFPKPQIPNFHEFPFVFLFKWKWAEFGAFFPLSRIKCVYQIYVIHKSCYCCGSDREILSRVWCVSCVFNEYIHGVYVKCIIFWWRLCLKTVHYERKFSVLPFPPSLCLSLSPLSGKLTIVAIFRNWAFNVGTKYTNTHAVHNIFFNPCFYFIFLLSVHTQIMHIPIRRWRWCNFVSAFFLFGARDLVRKFIIFFHVFGAPLFLSFCWYRFFTLIPSALWHYLSVLLHLWPNVSRKNIK